MHIPVESTLFETMQQCMMARRCHSSQPFSSFHLQLRESQFVRPGLEHMVSDTHRGHCIQCES
uniref:Uncharacterized protein n=1 Tax=Anguilla anguilla TaxID=7936 RepID=A0A0E9QJH5_ANGAN